LRRKLGGGTMPSAREQACETLSKQTNISALAGKSAPTEILVDLSRLEKDYFNRTPDIEDPNQLVAFGTSGHRGPSLNGTFTEAHVLAITQAICAYRRIRATSGQLYVGKYAHVLSAPAHRTAVEIHA